MTTVTTARPADVRPAVPTAWRERSARLYEELRRPSKTLVRRAFRGAFTDDEIEDVYSNAWVGTLRALERRHQELDDEEVRKYVLTAVAHHASKEIRRRRRRPVAPLDGVHAVADDGLPPDETATKREQSRVARDVLSSLPPRRRAVMMLRYGWGLEPKQVCGLVKGLSPRAYRKEITRGVDELAAKLRRVESGEWCSDREPVLKAYAAGLADDEQRRQAQQHLSHCRHCTDFVGKLSGSLHDIGSAAAIPAAADAIRHGHLTVLDRTTDLFQRAKDSAVGAFGRNTGDGVQETTAQTITASGSARGAGAAGTGVLAKLAGTGAAGKLTAMCLSGGVAATACLATGVVPARLPDLGGASQPKPIASTRPSGHPAHAQTARFGVPYGVPDHPPPEPDPAPPTTTTTVATPPPATTTTPTYTTTTTPPAPISPSAPPTQQEYGVASAATPTSSGGSSSSGGSARSAVDQEFGP